MYLSSCEACSGLDILPPKCSLNQTLDSKGHAPYKCTYLMYEWSGVDGAETLLHLSRVQWFPRYCFLKAGLALYLDAGGDDHGLLIHVFQSPDVSH